MTTDNTLPCLTAGCDSTVMHASPRDLGRNHGRCDSCVAGRYGGTRRPKPSVGGATSRAERLVYAWLEADFEPDDTGTAWMSAGSLDKLIARVAEVYDGQLARRPGGAEDQLIGIGTPRPVAEAHQNEESLRSPDCRGYSLCLDHAVREDWKSWTCRGCDGPSVRTLRTESGRRGSDQRLANEKARRAQ